MFNAMVMEEEYMWGKKRREEGNGAESRKGCGNVRMKKDLKESE